MYKLLLLFSLLQSSLLSKLLFSSLRCYRRLLLLLLHFFFLYLLLLLLLLYSFRDAIYKCIRDFHFHFVCFFFILLYSFIRTKAAKYCVICIAVSNKQRWILLSDVCLSDTFSFVCLLWTLLLLLLFNHF